jgi:hypothetical protein
MWEKVEAWSKEHPAALGIILFIGGALILYLLWPSSSASTTSTGTDDAYYNAIAAMAQSGNQLQEAQLSAQVQSNATQASLTAAQTQSAADVSVATINGQTASSVAQIQATADNYDTAANDASANFQSTLTAQTQQLNSNNALAATVNSNAAATNIAQINSNTSIQNTLNTAAAQLDSVLAQTNAAVSINQNNNATAIQQSVIGNYNAVNLAAYGASLALANPGATVSSTTPEGGISYVG